MSSTSFKYSKDKIKHQSNDSCLVNIKKNEVLMFSGYVKIKCKKGVIEINGFLINAKNEKSELYNLYSVPYFKDRCLSIKAIKDSQIELYPFDFTKKYRIKESSETCDSIFKIVGCKFIMNSNTNKDNENYRSLLIPSSWQQASKYFVSSSNAKNVSIMVCGRVQSGKSTFSRYLINCLLNKYEKIAYLDCDVGQSEFNPEGIISITIIKKPLFGPPHTHQHYNINNKDNDYYQCWKSYYFGSNQPMNDPSFYLKCISNLNKEWNEYNDNNMDNDDIPLIINTCGWTKRLGANILKLQIVDLNPDHLIEIYNKDEPLFGGVEMNYLSEVKQMFIHQNKIHNWCIDKKDKDKDKDENKGNKNNDNSLINYWLKQLTSNDELTIKNEDELKPSQKKWSQYLDQLVQLQFIDKSHNNNNNNNEWYNILNVSKSKNYKTNNEFQLFKTFINANVHYVESVGGKKKTQRQKIDEKEENKDELWLKKVSLKKERRKSAIQKRILSMVSYFTQQLFIDKPAQYLREMQCYKIPFKDISIMFLNDMVQNQILMLHGLNGVIIGLGINNDQIVNNDIVNNEMIKEPPMKRRKFNNNNNDVKENKYECKLNILNNSDHKNMECVGLGIIRSINFQKQLFYLITPICVPQLNKVNVFIRGETSIPGILIYDESILTKPLYINSTPTNDRILRSNC